VTLYTYVLELAARVASSARHQESAVNYATTVASTS
jgi:hypothetical protein